MIYYQHKVVSLGSSFFLCRNKIFKKIKFEKVAIVNLVNVFALGSALQNITSHN